MPNYTVFKKKIMAYYRAHGRDLPWRKTHDPYHILVSEIMLQQTQVPRVLERFSLFIEQFPSVEALAAATKEEVLRAWQGMGYNRRALYLWRIARVVVEQYGGELPRSIEALDELPGIGYNTACSIAAFAFNAPTVFIETNIRTVFLHEFFPHKEGVEDKDIFDLVQKTVDKKNPREWYYALMDYGTELKRKMINPSRRSKHYKKQSTFAGSDRQARGEAVRYILKHKKATIPKIAQHIMNKYSLQKERVKRIVTQLKMEGFF